MKPSRKKSASSASDLNIPKHFLPAKTLLTDSKTSQPSVRYFVDKFPMFFVDAPSPVVTFTYIQKVQQASLTDFVRHLESYLPLFRQLSEFRLVYVSRTDSHFEKAKEIFSIPS